MFCYDCVTGMHVKKLERRARLRITSNLYAISVKEDPRGLIKFGMTTNLDMRMKTLQCGSPVLLELLAQCKGKVQHERMIHRRLMRSRSHGEWFARTPETLEVVGLMKAGTLLDVL